jgi:hypothetical protein
MEPIASPFTSRAGFSPGFCGDLRIDEVAHPTQVDGGEIWKLGEPIRNTLPVFTHLSRTSPDVW